MDKFFIVTNRDKDEDLLFTKQIGDYISSKGKSWWMQENNDCLDGTRYRYTNAENARNADCAIVLGGDGTLIQAARDLSELGIPILGVNIGTLGYLTDIDKSHVFGAIDSILDNNYDIDERMILEGTAYRGNSIIQHQIALNDIVINREGMLKVIDFEVYVNNEYLISYSADGVIVSTPTGSTAYNLSAGGPIVTPNACMMVMTPVCPHSLNKSSVIFNPEDVVEIRMKKSRTTNEQRGASFDGDSFINLISGDRIVIRKSELTARFIRTKKLSFLEILRNKLS